MGGGLATGDTGTEPGQAWQTEGELARGRSGFFVTGQCDPRGYWQDSFVPNPSLPADRPRSRPQVMAHRGASRAEPENTVAAFRAAAAMGADAVELDVRRTADGVLVVHHDPRLADGRAIIETRAADLPLHVPHLGEALDACAPLWVNVEIKNDPNEPDFDAHDSIADATIDLLAARDEGDEHWLISSFRRETVDRCRAVRPGIATAWLVTLLDPATRDATLDRLVADGHTALHPWVGGVDIGLLEQCASRGLAVNTWTCDDPDRMRELVAWGVDGICTNLPDVALAVRAAS